MPFKRKLLLSFLIPVAVTAAAGSIFILYLYINKQVIQDSNVLNIFIGYFGLVCAVSIAIALYMSEKLSGPVIRNAEKLHKSMIEEFAAVETVNDKGIDELFRMEYEIAELIKRLNLAEKDTTRGFESIQAAMAVILEGIREGVVFLNEEFDIVYMNSAAQDILGESGALDEKRNLKDIAFAEDIKKGDGGDDDDNMIFHPRISPLRLPDGRVEGYLLVFWDVTEERQYEESRRRFISTLSHQLKTPMTSLTMSVSLLKEKLSGNGKAADELLDMAKSDCESLSSLISELIGASRDTTANLSLAMIRDDITSIISKPLRSLMARAEREKIEMKCEMDSPIFSEVDPTKFSWVVTNIVGNALRCTPSGGKISVTMRTRNEEAEICVSDTGPGISEEDLKNIFKPFVSLGENRDQDSMGLGLVIAREIVEAHNGVIDVESEPGKGSKFTIRIPLA